MQQVAPCVWTRDFLQSYRSKWRIRLSQQATGLTQCHGPDHACVTWEQSEAADREELEVRGERLWRKQSGFVRGSHWAKPAKVEKKGEVSKSRENQEDDAASLLLLPVRRLNGLDRVFSYCVSTNTNDESLSKTHKRRLTHTDKVCTRKL